MRRIVVAMDSMKGCLDSLSASKAIAEGFAASDEEIETVCVPVADGGEGTAVALSYSDGRYQKIVTEVTGPLDGRINAEWYIDKESGVAFIDMASAAGLALIEEERRNPLQTTSFGVGELIMEAASKGVHKIMLGLGGSATVDAGLGAFQAMGGRIYDIEANELPTPFRGGMLGKVADFKINGFLSNHKDIKLFLLCDVTAPFTGKDGAARVFGPQKGASESEVEVLEEGMDRIRKLIFEKNGVDLNCLAGSGAAGGAAGGLMSLAGGKIRNGAPLLLDAIGFDGIIEKADLIITGEGSSDRQTLMGKVPYEILQRGKRKNIPVWLVAGRVADADKLLHAGFASVTCINSPEIVESSETVGGNPMDPDVASRRLASLAWHHRL